jgi:hypothetical protein
MFDVMKPIKYAFPERTTHAKLQHLHIRASLFGDDDVGVGLFNALTLPNLGHLDFRHNGPWPHGEFKAFVTRSKCPLESLILGKSMTLTDQEKEECTSLIPSLKRFEVKGDMERLRRIARLKWQAEAADCWEDALWTGDSSDSDIDPIEN